MQRYTLAGPIAVTGYSFLGLRADMWLEPTFGSGWYVRIRGEDVELTPELLGSGFRHLQLRQGSWSAKIVEHLLPLRFSGLDGVRIVFERGSRVPFYGSGLPFLTRVERHFVPHGELTRYTLNDVAHPRLSNKRKKLMFFPGTNGLQIKIIIDYGTDSSIGAGTYRHVVSPDTFRTFATAKALGNFHWSKHLVSALGSLGWPHADQFVWRGQFERSLLRQTIAEHRVWDFLGALATAVPAGGFPEGEVVMFLANHGDDPLLMREIAEIGWRQIEHVASKAA